MQKSHVDIIIYLFRLNENHLCVVVAYDCGGVVTNSRREAEFSNKGKKSSHLNDMHWSVSLSTFASISNSNCARVLPKPFDNKPSHSMCCHLAIEAGTKIIPIQ